MMYLILAPILLIQLSSAQILSLGLQNGQYSAPVLQNYSPNLQRSINLPSNGVVLSNNGFNGINNNGIGAINTLPSPNIQLARNVQVPVSGIVNTGNAVNGNFLNTNTNFLNANLANNNVNFAGNNLANGFVSNNFANNNFGTNFVNRNVGTNWINANAPINLANGFNINTGTFALGNNAVAAFLPNGQPCGIQILADALEVGGLANVNGQLPFYTTVNVNGNLPSSGMGIANCACNGQ